MHYIFLFLLLLLILLMTVELRVLRGDNVIFEIHFVFFALSIDPSVKQKRKRKPKPQRFISNLKYLKMALDRHLSVTNATVYYNPDNLARNHIVQASLFFPFFDLLTLNVARAFLYSKCKSLAFMELRQAPGVSYSISFKFKLYQAFISLLFFVYYKLKNSIKRKSKNV